MSFNGQRKHAAGIYFDSRAGRWRVRIMHDRVSHHGGYYATEAEAEVAAAHLRRHLTHTEPQE